MSANRHTGSTVAAAHDGSAAQRCRCAAFALRRLGDHGGLTPFLEPPRSAAWQHREARNGFEVVFFSSNADRLVFEGDTAAVEDGEAWSVQYAISLGVNWHTRSARVTGLSTSGRHERTLQSDGSGRWWIDDEPAQHLEGCLDVDLESSAFTNAIPVHRLELGVDQQADAPAAYVRSADLRVERLEQRYVRLEDDGGRERYHYAAPAFDFECELLYDKAGLLLDYPGIAVRTA